MNGFVQPHAAATKAISISIAGNVSGLITGNSKDLSKARVGCGSGYPSGPVVHTIERVRVLSVPVTTARDKSCTRRNPCDLSLTGTSVYMHTAVDVLQMACRSSFGASARCTSFV
jgi:hypothetical protein